MYVEKRLECTYSLVLSYHSWNVSKESNQKNSIKLLYIEAHCRSSFMGSKIATHLNRGFFTLKNLYIGMDL